MKFALTQATGGLRVPPQTYRRTPSTRSLQQKGGFVMTQIIMGLGVSWGFGTSLAPIAPGIDGGQKQLRLSISINTADF